MSAWRRMPQDAAAARAAEPPEPELVRFGRDGWVPNNPALPVALWRGALPGATARAVKALYEANRWFRVWDWTVLDHHHYHSNAHEALACVAGRAVIRLGGPTGEDVALAPGDVAVLPAGTGHCRMAAEPGFTVVGGYPEGQEGRDLLAATEANWPGAAARIAATPLPRTDPVWGADGPLLRAWGGGGAA